MFSVLLWALNKYVNTPHKTFG